MQDRQLQQCLSQKRLAHLQMHDTMVIEDDSAPQWHAFAQGGKHVLFRASLCQALLRVSFPLPSDTEICVLTDAALWGSQQERTLTVEQLLVPEGHQHTLSCPSLPIQLAPALHCRLQALAGVPLSECEALLLPDLAAGGHLAAMASAEPLTLELKPKWGRLPEQCWLQPGHQLKAQHSRFQLLQKLKAAKGALQGSGTSSYDPLDLFSMQPARMQRALAALLGTPHNNLRAFEGGQQAPVARLLDCVASWGSGPGRADIFAVITEALQDSGVLPCLLHIQALDRFDIENVHPLWQQLQQTWEQELAEGAQQERPDASLCKRMQAGSNLRAASSLAQDCRQNTLAHLGVALDEAQGRADSPAALQARLLQLPAQLGVLVLKAYLLAAMAKDCSIMLSIAPCRQGVQLQLQQPSQQGGQTSLVDVGAWLQGRVPVRSFACGGRTYCYTLAVVDTEPKPLAKIEQHWQLDEQILMAHRT